MRDTILSSRDDEMERLWNSFAVPDRDYERPVDAWSAENSEPTVRRMTMKANLEKKKKLLDHFGYKKISFNNSQKNVKIKLES